MRIASLVSLSLLTVCALHAAAAQAAPAEASHYVGARVVGAEHKARDMSASARPGIGSFVPGQERNRFTTGALALGYQYGNGWRVEGEYTLPKRDTFTSGSTTFPTSRNVHYIQSQRLMANAYRDFAVADAVSVYGTLGLGVARLQSDGWQGVQTRRYIRGRQNNLSWSVGAGVAYVPVERLTLDLGYRYVEMGQAQSGWNAFGNARGLQDEMMRATLVSSEFYLGARYAF